MSQAEFPIEPTADGSQTFYSEAFGEWFHSREGAYAEAHHTYVEATGLVARSRQQPCITLLDVCYGLGYNTAAALAALWHEQPDYPVEVIGLELDATVPQAAIAQGLTQGWPAPVQAALHALAQGQPPPPPLQGKLLIGDARHHIQILAQSGWQADVIFFDPFSPPRCPQLWTVEFIRCVAQCLKPDGYLATYSCAAAVRSALSEAGLNIGALRVAGRRWPSTIASLTDTHLPPLSRQELEHLETRAAVPYRDPSLSDGAEVIHQRRSQEQRTSPLQPTGAWRKRWLSGLSSTSME